MNDGENNVTTSQEARYAEVSLRAVELLAKAQRAADEAVAEAQSYARDLEKSAREQYRQILQRAQTAAQQVATAEGARAESQPGGGGGGGAAVDAQQLAYVRTYARVAHTQLKSVLAALNDELDQLAAMAEGASATGAGGPGAAPPGAAAPGPPPPARQAPPREAPGTYGSPQAQPPVTPPSAPVASSSAPVASSGAEPPWRPSEPPWQPSEPPATTARPSARPGESNGAAAWPPIAAATTSISYFHRGSTWEGPR